MIRYISGVSLFILLSVLSVDCRRSVSEDVIRLPSEVSGFIHNNNDVDDDSVGTRWAVLIAGSSGYWNYRHQADVCHAYQIMKKGGLKDENIVVFMYDDIAFNEQNPRPGVIINNPHGENVYEGVPKDYVGNDVTVANFLAVLLGDKSAVKGGSGKVVDSGPNDHVFVYYTDHGGPGVLGMPTYPHLYANDLIDALKKKHALGAYKSLVFYLEACESGSIFEGLLPEGLNIYATTASNASESSWGTYCPGRYPSPPPEYTTCLGDLYSIAWMEDSDWHNLRTETLKQQYQLVKAKTLNGLGYGSHVMQYGDVKRNKVKARTRYDFLYGSHVMQYGDVKLSEENLFLYMGSNPANDNITFIDSNSLPTFSKAVSQRDADLVHFWHKLCKAPEGSPRKLEAQRELLEVMSHRVHVDNSIKLVGKLLFGFEKDPQVLAAVRSAGKPLVDDWECLKTMVRTFETHCGSLSQYGMKHMRSVANICNAGVQKEQMAEVSSQACLTVPAGSWSSIHNGFSA